MYVLSDGKIWGCSSQGVRVMPVAHHEIHVKYTCWLTSDHCVASSGRSNVAPINILETKSCQICASASKCTGMDIREHMVSSTAMAQASAGSRQ